MEEDRSAKPSNTPSPAQAHTTTTTTITNDDMAKDRAGKPHKDGAAKEKKREKKRKGGLMSFDVEDDGSIPSFGPSLAKDKDKDKERKKKKRKHKQVEDDDDSMWVEKPAPEVVKGLPVQPVEPDPVEKSTALGVGREAGPPRGRKRAIDFM